MTLRLPHNMRSWLFNALLCANLAACNDNQTTPPPAAATPTPVAAPLATAQNSPTTTSLPAPFALAQQKNCVVCHSISSKMVGPSWISVSERYRNDNNAVNTLTTRILNGGSGTFGAVVMPPQTANLTPEEAKYLAQWVLTLK
ncbi:Cytochrome c-552 [Ephemeroptericola cinctiostellae]|uniref:Cytochrome c-552 n=1 Tax=Ephemeroptericola cinctiostellae TaxID=2268024 RepID=A0A345D9V5_9BURK|nr:c-type cytochrome [Ephemeroptericola cinctiostellae]AXF85143.1 Cytochrome c-552 [Ephemeroptericola cinctiostellae]